VRVAIFIDGKRHHAEWRGEKPEALVDYHELAGWLTERIGTTLAGAWYYTAVEGGDDGSEGLERFLRRLELEPGYYVRRIGRRRRPTRCPECDAEVRAEEVEVATAMVTDMVRLAAANAFDVMVLVSGEAHHAPAVEAVRAFGKQVYTASWGETPRRLRQLAYDHVDLGEGTEELQSIPPPPPLPSNDARETFVAELRKAEAKFHDGYVGANYFVTRWRAEGFDDDPEGRRQILAALEDEGRVEVYHAPDGNKALRVSS